MGKTLQEVEALIPNLVNIKSQIRQAIIDKGVEIPQDSSLCDYAGYIDLILPSGVYLLDYIAKNGNSYFDLGFSLNTTDVVEIKHSASTMTDLNPLFGTINSTNNRYVYYNRVRPCILIGSENMNYSTDITGDATAVMNVYNSTTLNLRFNDKTDSKDTTIDTSTNPYNVFLFGLNRQGSIDNNQPCEQGAKFYYMKVTNSNVLLHFIVPVLKNGVPCLYDLVTTTYIYHTGETTPSYKLSIYQLLDWIGNGESETANARGSVSFGTGINMLTAMNYEYNTKVKPGSNYDGKTYNEGILFGGTWRDEEAAINYKNGMYMPYNGATANGHIGWKEHKQNSNVEKVDFNNIYKVSTYVPNGDSNRYIKLNGVSSSSKVSVGNDSYKNNIELCIFATQFQSAWKGCKFYYFTISDNDQCPKPIRSYVPIIYKNIPCMYELNSKNIIYNSFTDFTPTYGKLS